MVLTQVPAQRAEQEARRDWWMSAACREADPELFFPVASRGPAAGEIARAKAVCAVCRVRRQCLQYALATHQMHGVWGGTTEDERQVQVRDDREHGRRERRQREHADTGGPGRAEPGGNGARDRGSRLRSLLASAFPCFPEDSPAAARRTRPPGKRRPALSTGGYQWLSGGGTKRAAGEVGGPRRRPVIIFPSPSSPPKMRLYFGCQLA